MKNKKYCNNCGKQNHLLKFCNEPITSFGIIGVKLTFNHQYINNIINNIQQSKFFDDVINTPDFFYNAIQNSELFDQFSQHIKFLLIRRRFTLGFMEFIRGKYNINNIDSIKYLCRQMIQSEIDLILNNNFFTLWAQLWYPNSKLNYNTFQKTNEFQIAEDKFNFIKTHSILNNILDDLDITWKEPEWGFPKGRKNYYEDNLTCAIREFQEETNLNSRDFILFDNIEPFEENFIGTNGTKYRHVYFFAIIQTSHNITIHSTNKTQIHEIGDIGFFNYNDAINLIRHYQTDRLDILKTIFSFILQNLIFNI